MKNEYKNLTYNIIYYKCCFMYNFEFIFDEKEIVNCAVKNVLRAYDNRVPDFFPFPKPLSYDNLIKHT